MLRGLMLLVMFVVMLLLIVLLSYTAAGSVVSPEPPGISVPTYGVVVRADGCTLNPCPLMEKK